MDVESRLKPRSIRLYEDEEWIFVLQYEGKVNMFSKKNPVGKDARAYDGVWFKKYTGIF